MGNLQYNHIFAVSAILTLLLMPAATGTLNVSVSPSKPQYSPGETVAISGKVLDNVNNPVLGAAVSIQVNTPQNTPIHINLVYSDGSGSYSDSFALASNSPQGQYAIFASASKTGFDTGQTQSQFSVTQPTTATTSASTSSQTSVQTSSTSTQTSQTNQIGRLCLIATATYGSELSPEVALLRNFRDSKILRTSVGRSFLVGFNAFYYSFSPAVAQMISEHEAMRDSMRILLYPVVAILSVSSSLYDVLSINSELAVTVSGIFAAVALGMVYLGPLLLGFRRILRVNSSRWRLVGYSTVVASAASLVLLGIAELSHNPTFLLLASSGAVLSLVALGGISVPNLASMIATKIARVKSRD